MFVGKNSSLTKCPESKVHNIIQAWELTQRLRHPGEGRGPEVTEIYYKYWIPAKAGMSAPGSRRDLGGESPPPGNAHSR